MRGLDLNVKVVADASGVEGTNKSLQQCEHEGHASHVTRHTSHVTRHNSAETAADNLHFSGVAALDEQVSDAGACQTTAQARARRVRGGRRAAVAHLVDMAFSSR